MKNTDKGRKNFGQAYQTPSLAMITNSTSSIEMALIEGSAVTACSLSVRFSLSLKVKSPMN